MSFVALWVGVGVLGGLAAIARVLVDRLVVRVAGAGLAVGTFVVNLSGSVVLGLLVGIGLHGDGYLLAGTAVVGSYTTFSTWVYESHHLAEAGRSRWAVANIVFSVVLGVAAVALGRLIGGG